MDLRRFWHPRTLFALGALALTVVIVACGGATTTPATTSSGAAAPAAVEATPTLDPFAGAQEPTPTAVLGEAPTAVPVPTAIAVDQRPDWWQEGEANHYHGDFPLVATSNPGFWDVHYGGSMNTVLIPSGPRFNQLLEYNPINPGEIIGDLAVNWESYQDGDEFGYIFNLHPDATFSDGRPVTGEDVAFSIDRITLGQVEEGVLRARTGFLNNFVVHGTAAAIDEKTVKIPLRFPAAGFLPNLASDYMKVYPKHVAENLSQEQANQGIIQTEAVAAINSGTPVSLIGSGPWMLRDWEKDVGYSFDRNPTYFKEGRPFFDGLKIFLIRDTARRLAALQAGAGLRYLPARNRQQPPRGHGPPRRGHGWSCPRLHPGSFQYPGLLPQSRQASV